MFGNNIPRILGAYKYSFGVALVLFVMLVGIFIEYPLQDKGLVVSPSLVLSSFSSGSSSNHIANAQVLPALEPNPPHCVIRGFPDGVTTGGPPAGKGLLVIEELVDGCTNMLTGIGGARPTDFSIEVAGNIVVDAGTSRERVISRTTLPGAGVLILNPGSYSVSEILPGSREIRNLPNYGYIPISYEGDCKNTSIAAGQTKLCTIRNQQLEPLIPLGQPPPNRAYLTIHLLIVHDDGRTVPNFNLRVTNNDATVTSGFGPIQALGPYTTSYTLPYILAPGRYAVTQSSFNSFYPPIYLRDSQTGNIDAGQHKFVTVINNDRQ